MNTGERNVVSTKRKYKRLSCVLSHGRHFNLFNAALLTPTAAADFSILQLQTIVSNTHLRVQCQSCHQSLCQVIVQHSAVFGLNSPHNLAHRYIFVIRSYASSRSVQYFVRPANQRLGVYDWIVCHTQ